MLELILIILILNFHSYWRNEVIEGIDDVYEFLKHNPNINPKGF